MSKTVLAVTASVQQDVSISRELVTDLIEQLTRNGQVDTVIERDLSSNQVELLTASHVGAFYTPAEERSEEQKALLAQSDKYLDELKQADTLVIGTPMYNFSIPAVLKAWIDLICRVGESFRYTENGPEGLLNIEKAYIVVATGGAPIDSPVDFVVPYLKQVAKFIGVKEVEVIAADRTNAQREEAIAIAKEKIRAQ